MVQSLSANGFSTRDRSRLAPVIALVLMTVGLHLPAFSADSTVGVRNPGRVLVNVNERRAYLQSVKTAITRECPRVVPKEIRPIASISGRGGPQSDAISAMIPMMDYGAACLAGDIGVCMSIVSTMQNWASSNALVLQYEARKGADFWDAALTANLMLKSMIISYAIARTISPVDAGTDASILTWLESRVRDAQNTDESPRNAGQNHFVMSSSVAMAMGALSGNTELFRLGVDRYRIALGELREDGSFPHETRRGSRAIRYTNLQLNVMISIAEMATLQGIDLYSERGGHGKTIHDAVGYALSVLENHDRIINYASENHAAPRGSVPQRQDLQGLDGLLSWGEIYAKRFPAHPNTQRLAALQLDPRTCTVAAPAPAGCKRTSSGYLNAVIQRPLRSNWLGTNASCVAGPIPFPGIVRQ